MSSSMSGKEPQIFFGIFGNIFSYFFGRFSKPSKNGLELALARDLKGLLGQ
jgi:hypothetical protein